jgi:hypothetical protein
MSRHIPPGGGYLFAVGGQIQHDEDFLIGRHGGRV